MSTCSNKALSALTLALALGLLGLACDDGTRRTVVRAEDDAGAGGFHDGGADADESATDASDDAMSPADAPNDPGDDPSLDAESDTGNPDVEADTATGDSADVESEPVELPEDLPLANQTQSGRQWGAEVAATTDGGFALAWFSTVADGSRSDIVVRFFGGDGTPRGDELVVSEDGTWQNTFPAIAAVDGGVAVAWTEAIPGEESSSWAIRGALVDDAPQPGPVTSLSPPQTFQQHEVNLSTLTSGDLVLAWNWEWYDGDFSSVVARVLHPSLMAANANFQLSQTSEDSQTRPRTAPLVGGGFVATWNDYNERNAAGRIFDGAGQATTDEFSLNRWDTNGVQWMARAVGLDDGSFFVTYPSGSSGQTIEARQIDSSGEIVWSGRVGDDVDVAGQAAAVARRGDAVLVFFMGRQGSDQPWSLYRAAWGSEQPAVGASGLVYGAPAMQQVAPEAAALTGGDVVVVWQCADTDREGVCVAVVGE